MSTYEEYLSRCRTEYITMDDPDIHYHYENLKRSKELCSKLNLAISSEEKRALFKELFGNYPDDVEVNPPFNCEVGHNIILGHNNFINYGCVILDVGVVRFGDNVMLGPGVKIIAVDHPRRCADRVRHEMIGRDVTLGNDVWIGTNAVIMPGITIGNNVIVGAGAVVTKDVPSDSVVVGVPARIVSKFE